MCLTRRIVFVICNLLFGVTLLTTIVLAVFNLSFRTPKLIKNSFKDTKAYQRFLPTVLKADSKQLKNISIPLEDPQLLAIADRAFPPQLLQQNSEQLVDSTYDWLYGKTAQPHFRIDLSDAKLRFANELSSYVVQRLSKLPICETFSLNSIQNVYTAQCQPRGLPIEVAKQALAAQISNSKDFLPQAVFTENDLPKNSKGDTIVRRFVYAPLAFRTSYALMWVSAGLTLLLSTGMIFLSPSRRKGWRSLGITALSEGVFVVITALIVRHMLPEITHSLSTQFSVGGAELILNDVALRIASTTVTLFIRIAVLVIAVGVLIIVAQKILKRKKPFAKPL